jgi:hypothetical protein
MLEIVFYNVDLEIDQLQIRRFSESKEYEIARRWGSFMVCNPTRLSRMIKIKENERHLTNAQAECMCDMFAEKNFTYIQTHPFVETCPAEDRKINEENNIGLIRRLLHLVY